MTEREAGLCIKRVRKHNFGTGTRQNSDSDSQVHTQPTQGHNTTRRRDRSKEETSGSGHKEPRQTAPGTTTSQNHNTTLQTPGNTQVTATAQYTHSTLLKSSNQPMAAARRRHGQQLYAWHGTPSRRPQAAPPFPLTPAGGATQSQPPALPPEAWPCEYNTNKAK